MSFRTENSTLFTLKTSSENFKNRWEQTLTKCLIGLMGLLIEHYQSEMGVQDTEIQTLWQNTNHLQSSTVFLGTKAVLNEHLDKFNREIISSKELKFIRDKKAFNSGRAYRWSNPAGRKPFMNLRCRNDNVPANE